MLLSKTGRYKSGKIISYPLWKYISALAENESLHLYEFYNCVRSGDMVFRQRIIADKQFFALFSE